jgi:hypothetical protein
VRRVEATARPGSAPWSGNDRDELGHEGIEVDLVAQAGAERLDGLGGVVAAPVEALIHGALDATAGRLQQRSHGEGGGGHGQGGAILPQ